MASITAISGRALPLRGNELDTDRIMPARFLKAVTFDGLEHHEKWRARCLHRVVRADKPEEPQLPARCTDADADGPPPFLHHLSDGPLFDPRSHRKLVSTRELELPQLEAAYLANPPRRRARSRSVEISLELGERSIELRGVAVADAGDENFRRIRSVSLRGDSVFRSIEPLFRRLLERPIGRWDPGQGGGNGGGGRTLGRRLGLGRAT